MLLCIAFLLGTGTAGLGVQSGAAPPVRTLKPLYLRIEVMTDAPKTVPCRIECSDPAGKAYDRAAFDLDGDGRFEKTVGAEKGRFGSGPSRFGLTVPLEQGTYTYSLELSGSLTDPFQEPGHLLWSVKSEKGYLWFINGRVTFHETPEAAASGKALRLGPPFRFEVSTRTRGSQALVNVGLKDANDATLRVAYTYAGSGTSRERKESNIHLTFLEDGNSIEAEFG